MKDAAARSIDNVLEELETSRGGLTSEEAARRLAEHGPNTLVEKKQVSFAYKFLAHFKDLFGVLLLFASLLAAIGAIWENDFSMWEMSFMILAVVLVNTVMSLFQEWRAEKAMETLRRWMPEYAKVFRDCELKKISVTDLVSGDVVILEEGDRVPADARLFEAFELWTNNVPLTGESEPQPRTSETVEVPDAAYLDAQNLVFMSTSVARGQGKAIVVNTGMDTKFGQIAGLTQEIHEEPSPLQKEIAYTARVDFILALTVGVVFFLTSLIWLKLSFIGSILFMIGVMVACVPEGLQVTVSSALAINVLKMAKENVLVKKLSAVQTLGSVTVVCTDKTGTITKGEMTLRKIWVHDEVVEVSGVGYTPIGEFTCNEKPLSRRNSLNAERILEISALCSNAKVEPPSDRNRSWSIVGDPTDGAMLVGALKYGLTVQSVLVKKPMIHVIPFDSERKRMTTVHKNNGGLLAYTKGAPRNILAICDRLQVGDRVQTLVGERLDSVEAKIREFAGEGLRVMAVAYKELPEESDLEPSSIEENMILVGLAAIKDPLGLKSKKP